MIVLDASLVIAQLSARDPHHQRASTYLREAAGHRFLMHSLNLAEVLVGAVRAGRGEELLSDLQDMGIEVADRAEGEPLRLASLRAESGLKLPDCCALDTALQTGFTLATFDEALAAAARAAGVTVAPST